jgi:uncharacterized Zn-finger protein
MVMKRVSENKTGTCPYCHRHLKPDEGWSEMSASGFCKVGCPYCGKTYTYIDKRLRKEYQKEYRRK